MAREEQAWVQGQLFPLAVAGGRRRGGPGERSGHRLDRSRVTRDADVALAYERTQQAQHEVKLGLARAWSRLSPEKRRALRDALTATARVA